MDFLKMSIDTEGAAAFLEELARRVRIGEVKLTKMKASEAPQTAMTDDYDMQPTGRTAGDLKMAWEVSR